MNHLLDHLKNKGWVWQGDFSRPLADKRTAGENELLSHLPGGLAAYDLVEIHSTIGIGELRFLLPRLEVNSSDRRLQVWIAPPHKPNAECLHQAGLDLSQLWVIRPAAARDALWTAEQCLKSGACHSVLLWHGELNVAQVKRLQQACQQGRAQLFLLHGEKPQSQSLPVSLSLRLQPHDRGLQVTINKCRGSWPPAPFTLEMHKRWPRLCLPRCQETRNVIPFPRAQAS